MGMYTEVFFRAEVDEEAYGIVRQIIQGEDPATFRDTHPLFAKARALAVFAGESYYHPYAYHAYAEDKGGAYGTYVSFRSSLKDYEGEIEAFFDWVTPHVVNSGAPGRIFIGYSLYEEATEPTLYYTKEN